MFYPYIQDINCWNSL